MTLRLPRYRCRRAHGTVEPSTPRGGRTPHGTNRGNPS
ncbi:hypothetical protein STXM2123_2750 [Streptomyces sp. F-3]|nr:hypothetical protein STXM2123_2750 [Streptomyces sp. F-3]